MSDIAADDTMTGPNVGLPTMSIRNIGPHRVKRFYRATLYQTLIYQSYSLHQYNKQEIFITQSYLYLLQGEITPIYNDLLSYLLR